ncbi:MAG TPA: tetratricopeptide repeat protein [Steroidobacteraceae bacterium]|nr:tetratricopeptide repeat protein [Steroidobacteraceae bacterium]
MKKLSRIALTAAAALLLGNAMVARAADSTPAKPSVSKAAGKDLQDAQKALADKNYDAALASLAKVKANDKKNDYDEYVMDEFLFTAYAGQKNYEAAEAPLEAAMASKYMPPDELKQRLYQAANLSYQLKKYDKAVEFGKKAIDQGETSAQAQMIVGESYYLQNDFKNTDSFLRGVVDDEIKAGQTPSSDMIEVGLSASAKLNDEPGETHWLELMVTYHPTTEYWENLLDTMYHNKLTDRETLQLYRLSAEVGTLKHGTDFSEMAQLALDAGSPGEAVTTLNNAFTANAFTDAKEKARNQQLLESAKKQAAADQPTLAKMEAESGTAKTGDGLVGAGIGYFSYGNYPKAIADLTAGLAKGTTKDSKDARLLLGIAQLKSGDKDSAVKTFQSVKGDAVYERLAALWILRAKAPPPQAT